MKYGPTLLYIRLYLGATCHSKSLNVDTAFCNCVKKYSGGLYLLESAE